jgi:intracellular septation protein
MTTLFSTHNLRKIFVTGILEFGPILLFLLSFDFFHIYKATLILMVATIVSTVVTYIIQKRLPYLALYIAFLTTTFGYMTLMHREPRFIQMRDTLYDVTFALTLIVGLFLNISFLKIAFHRILPMTEIAWKKITYGWIIFFLLSASLNEYIRRTLDLHNWFDFKSVMVGVTIVFGVTSLYFFYEKENHTTAS